MISRAWGYIISATWKIRLKKLNINFQSNIDKFNNSLNNFFDLHVRANKKDFLIQI
jgi:hypothetical protein